MRSKAWLRRALNSIDFIYFNNQLAERSSDIKWFRPPSSNQTFLYGEVDLKTNVICINSVLAYPWVPDSVALSTVFHECLHIVLGFAHDNYFNLMERQFPNHAEVVLWESASIDRLMKAERPLVRSLK